FVEDVTERKRIEEREKMLHSLLRHDVKNKILIAQGYIDLIKELELNQKVEEYLEGTDRTIDKCVDIISKVSDLRKAQYENIQKIDVITEINEAISSSKSMIVERDIDIEVQLDFDECYVMGGKLLNQLFYNLIENMINHSDGSKLKISLKEDGEEVICRLEDDGIGIQEKDQEKIFNKGYTTDEERGTGLGLFLVKRLIDSYGGSVEVRDSDMSGARFDIHLKKV
ncbi:MAG: sensor histidine kinase, partial [Thermoplasmatota archaeon]